MNNLLKVLEVISFISHPLFMMLPLFLLIGGLNICNIYQNSNKNKQLSLKVAVKIGFKAFFQQIGFLIALWLIILLCLQIDIFDLLIKHSLVKMGIIATVALSVYRGYVAYRNLRFYDFLDEIEQNKYDYNVSQLEYENALVNCRILTEILTQKIEILKSITPISIISILAPNILEGKNININWNMYTIVFIVISAFVAFLLYSYLKKLCATKQKYAAIEKRLNKYKYQK